MKRLLPLRRLLFGLCAAAGLTGWLLPASAAPQRGDVVLIPIHGTIDEGMAHLVARSVDEANASGARAIVLDIDTFGGLVSAATEIRDALLASRVPTYAYVSGRAWSAGALIALAAQHIEISPGASIGAAEPIPTTVKTISALRGEFESTALHNRRDPKLAAAMVDPNADAPDYKKSGAILTLNAQDARRAHYADGVYDTQAQMLRGASLAGAPLRIVEYSFGEDVARFATSPEISGILLTLGMLGLLIEMQTLHGIAGAIGIGSFALFFGTHFYAGFSNGLVLALAVLGVLGILYELHVMPGHGVPGILGGVFLLTAVLLAFGIPFFFVAVQTIATSLVATVLLFVIAARVFPENAFIKKLTFTGTQGPDYVSSSDFSHLLGRSGTAASFLRPAGVASIDGRRVDVLTEGDFLPAGTAVRVSRVEGARIFVKPTSNLPTTRS